MLISVNSKLLQSCQFQIPVVMSSQFQSICPMQLLCVRPSDQFASKNILCLSIHSVNGQVASSNARTACACQFTLVIGQVASSNTRIACTCALVSVISQATSSNTRTACASHSVSVISQATSSNTRTACAHFS